MSNEKDWNIASGSFKYKKDSPLLSYSTRPSENTSLSANHEISRSYGATRKPEVAPCNYTTIKHVLEPGDTLQGLAIKYQVTVEQIKRANRLWTHDNIHLQVYKELKIPVKLDLKFKDNRTIYRNDSNSSTVSLNDVDLVDSQDNMKNAAPSSSHGNEQGKEQTLNSGKTELASTNSQLLQSLLEQIDAQIKVSVKESQKLRDITGPKVLESIEKPTQESLEDNDLWRPLGNAGRQSRRARVQRASTSRSSKQSSLQDSDEQFFEL